MKSISVDAVFSKLSAMIQGMEDNQSEQFISNDNYSNIDTNVQSFKTFVQSIFDKGYKLCSSSFYFSCPDKSNLIICTFDDGYTGVKEYGLPILKEFGFTATVFVCSNYIGKKNDWNLKDKKNRTLFMKGM